MLGRRITSIVLLILGIAMFIFGSYISGQVAQGEKKIANAQQNVNQVRKLTKASPYTKGLGKVATQPVQQKINEGKQTASQYKKVATWLHIGGSVLFILGVVLLIFSFSDKKKK